MEKNENLYYKRTLNRLCCRFIKRHVSLLCAIVVMVISVFTFLHCEVNLMKSVESRALTEVESTVGMQKSAFKNHMKEQFQPLRLVADMLADGRHFASKGIQPTLNSIIRTFELCTLCLADTEGNVIDYQGTSIGNCSDREYFQEIMDGSHTQICEYLSETKATSEPRVILSVPAYDENGKMLGVLFCSKEISVLEDALFVQADTADASSILFVCDESGAVIVRNESAYDFLAKYNISESGTLNINDLSDGVQGLSDDDEAQKIEINGSRCFVGCVALDECGWKLYGFMDEANASANYSDNLKRMEKTLISVVLILIACIVIIVVAGWSHMRRQDREADLIKHYNENYKNILSSTHCAVLEYEVDTGTIKTMQENFGDLKLGALNGTIDAYESYKHMHPEFDFEELESEIEIAKKKGINCSFETILAPEPDKFYWLKTKMIPIADTDGKIKHIFCVLFDVSDLHYEHEKALDTYAQIPGAVHRHILTNPIHVNYYSEGLCKMLGYTHAEIDEIIGPQHLYYLLICTEDREKYISFLDKIAKSGGVRKNANIVCSVRMASL